MNRAQRVVSIFFCLLIAYCCAWIPWCIPQRNSSCKRVGYGWIWAGPAWDKPRQQVLPTDASITPPSAGVAPDRIPPPPKGFTLEGEAGTAIPDPDPSHVARPDMELMGLRLLAGFAVLGAAFLIAGMFKSSGTVK
ncbi:MAG: hypothetical protein WCA27_22470 [Candidatus Sulfotelmatobacter sp.]